VADRRQSLEASLRSEYGEQRLVRTTQNHFNRMTLVPREPLQLLPVVWVDWRDDEFALEVADPEWWPVTMNGRRVDAGRHRLRDGQRFTVGKAELSFHLTRRSWPVDLERERELLARDDAAAWAIYGDELLAREDPLGALLARNGTPDVPLGLEVQPLVARGTVSFVTDARGLWREVTFRQQLTEGFLSPGVIDAVLTHPLAWFVRKVTLALSPSSRSFRAAFVAQAQRSEERRVGKECRRLCRSRWSPYH
jgi:hypothetical protein